MKNKVNAVCCALILLAGLMVIGCAKVPDKLISPMLKIEPVVKNNAEMFKLLLSAGIQNENSDTVFMNVKGTIFFSDPGKSNSRVLSLPFTVAAILPFETGIVEIDTMYAEKDIKPLRDLLGGDWDKSQNDKVIERSFSDDNRLGFELAEYDKRGILDVLKEKVK